MPVEGGGTVVLYERVNGTAGTPTATKGTVSNHAITVTPSVTNTAGYISGGTKTGTGVSVAASELVSGTLPLTSNGTGIDVTNYQKVDVNVSGGGGPYDYFGPGTEYMGVLYSQSINLSTDTSFDSWEASTTATTLLAAASNVVTQATDPVNYSYYVVQKNVIRVAYNSGATLKATPYIHAAFLVTSIYGRWSSYTNMTTDTLNSITTTAAAGAAASNIYYNSTGALSLQHTTPSSSYMPGYMNFSVPSISGMNFRLSRAAVQARCHSTYFATGRKADIDSANTTINYTAEWYRTPRPSLSNAMNTWLRSIINS